MDDSGEQPEEDGDKTNTSAKTNTTGRSDGKANDETDEDGNGTSMNCTNDSNQRTLSMAMAMPMPTTLKIIRKQHLEERIKATTTAMPASAGSEQLEAECEDEDVGKSDDGNKV